MQKEKTYFEQVRLDAIKRIIEEDNLRRTRIEKPGSSKVEAVEKELLLAGAANRAGGRS